MINNLNKQIKHKLQNIKMEKLLFMNKKKFQVKNVKEKQLKKKEILKKKEFKTILNNKNLLYMLLKKVEHLLNLNNKQVVM